MTRVHVRAAALADLDTIWLHIAGDDPVAADDFIEEFDARCARLRRYPQSGPPRPEIGPGLRSLGVGRYLIFYRLGDGRVDIVRVIHGARDLGALDLG